MACATLKRHLEFEPSTASTSSPSASVAAASSFVPSKRMRCTGSPQSSPFRGDFTLRSGSMSQSPPPSSSSPPPPSQLQQQFLQQQQHQYYLYHQQQQQQQQQSPFAHNSNQPSAITRLTQDKLAVRIIDELLKKRLITWNSQNEQQQFEQLQQQQQQQGQQLLENASLGFEKSVVVNTSDLTFNSEKPIFTFCQVNKICRKILQDYEKELCDEYEKILARKLSEQYETFVRFSQDQIRKHFHTIQPSYLS